jgi:hypothetical protein
MEDPLEYDLLPLPWEITHQIVLACRRDVSVKQLGNLRLLNKTWKAAIDAGIFGPHGRLMCSQKSTRFAMLVGAPCGVNKVSVRPAVGLLDERCRDVYICPVPSRNSLSFDGRSLKQGGDRISLLNKSIYILEEGCDSPQGNLEPVQSTRWVRMRCFQSGEWHTEYFEEGARDPTLGTFATRFCFAGEGRIFCVGKDVCPGAYRAERVLSYEPRTRRWSLLPAIVEQESRRLTESEYFHYASDGSLHSFAPGEFDRYDYPAEWWMYSPIYKRREKVLKQNPRCYSYALNEPDAGWNREGCKQEVQDLLAKQLTSELRIDPSSLHCCKRDGLMALLRSAAEENAQWLARERQVPSPPGEKTFRQMSCRKFVFQQSVTGVVPVDQLKGTGCLVLGASSAVVLRDGEAQKPVNLRWRGELESGGFEVLWASAFPVDDAQSDGRTGEN